MAPSLTSLHSLIGEDLATVNTLIAERMASKIPLICDLTRHLIAAGGKRLRPMVTLGAARLCGYEGTRQHRLAACVEFIHTATLLHDDVVDASRLRRGAASANDLWGNKTSVLVGDFLFSRAFELMVEDGSLKILEILSSTSSMIAEGEVNQLIIANDLTTSHSDYIGVIAAKTAALFKAAAQVGAVVANRPPDEEAALAEFGYKLGIAFQLVDDALDYSDTENKLGKTLGDDFRDGKLTLPIIFAFADSSAKEQKFWRRTIETLEQTPADFIRAQHLLTRHRAIERTLEEAKKYVEDAISHLFIFPNTPARQALIEATQFTVVRAY